MNNSKFDEVLTLDEAAEYLRLDQNELVTELETGKLPGLKVGNKWRIKKDVLDKLLDGSLQGASIEREIKNGEEAQDIGKQLESSILSPQGNKNKQKDTINPAAFSSAQSFSNPNTLVGQLA